MSLYLEVLCQRHTQLGLGMGASHHFHNRCLGNCGCGKGVSDCAGVAATVALTDGSHSCGCFIEHSVYLCGASKIKVAHDPLLPHSHSMPCQDWF